MTADILSRGEQRLRKQAELQSLYTTLASKREREASFIKDSAIVPEWILNQINEVRHNIKNVEDELAALEVESTGATPESSARKSYHQAFEAEISGEFSKAIKLYRNAARYTHPDASAAVRSVRYQSKTAKDKPVATEIWLPTSAGRSRSRLVIGAGAVLLLILIALFVLFGRSSTEPGSVMAVAPTATPTFPLLPTSTSTPTSTATQTPTHVPSPTDTPQPPPLEPSLTNTPTSTATSVAKPTFRSAPKVIGPKNGLVWGDGAIVFEFEDSKLAYDELYCLNTLRGYDSTNTENWSYVPVGKKIPRIPIDANAFHVAKAQDIKCVVWSAFIAKETCDNVISESTAARVIGLPHACDFGSD